MLRIMTSRGTMETFFTAHFVVDDSLAGDGALFQAVEGGGVVLIGDDDHVGVVGGKDLLGLALVQLLQFLKAHIKIPPFAFFGPFP